MMQKIIAILQVKSQNFADFTLWLKWYLNFIKCDAIYIINDNSLFDLRKIIELFNQDKKINYFEHNDLKNTNAPGGNLQCKIYNEILNRIKPNKDDIILIPDNDEFWWYDKTKYKSFNDCVNDYRIKLENPSALYVPWTLMRSKEILQSRKPTQNYFECFRYRTNIENCEHKPVMFYKGLIDTSFHCGYSDGKTITEPTNLFYHSKCVYDLPLRCYHFRFTTVEEYANKRKEEISVKFCPRPYMKPDFSPQIFNGEDQNGNNYNIEDLTLLEAL